MPLLDVVLFLLLAVARSVTWDGPDTPHWPTDSPTATQAPLRGSVGRGEGFASWYDDGPGLYAAAGPALRLRPDWRGSRVRVCAESVCVTVTLRDWCACSPRGGLPTVIDLSPAAFRTLAPLSRGLVNVTTHGM